MKETNFKQLYNQLFNKKAFCTEHAKKLKVEPESLRIMINQGTVGKKHSKDLLELLESEIEKQNEIEVNYETV